MTNPVTFSVREQTARSRVRRAGLAIAVALVFAWGTPSSHAFIRGNVNGDGVVDVSDVVNILARLFIPGTPALDCPDVGDVNDDGLFDVSDAVYLLASLFIPGSPPPPAPYPDDGFDPTPTDPFTCGDAPPMATSAWLFVVDQGGSLHFAPLDPDDGMIGAATNFTLPGAGRPKEVVASPDGRYLYVVDLDTGVHMLEFDPTGPTLVPLAGSPIPAGGFGSRTIVAHPTAPYLYVGRTSEVIAFEQLGDGTLVPVPGSWPTSSFVSGLVIDPTGTRLYDSSNADEIFGFDIDLATGALTPILGSPFPDANPGGSPQALAFIGPTAYSMTSPAMPGPGSVSAWEVGTDGALAPVGLGPWDTGGEATTSQASSPCVAKGDLVVVGHSIDAAISIFVRDPATSELTLALGSPIATTGWTHKVEFHPSLDVIYCTGTNSSTVDAFSVDPVAGTTAPIGFPTALSGAIRGILVLEL